MEIVREIIGMDLTAFMLGEIMQLFCVINIFSEPNTMIHIPLRYAIPDGL